MHAKAPHAQPQPTLPRVAILIPFRQWDPWCADCVAACAALDYPEVELWLLPDAPLPAAAEAEARQRAGPRPFTIAPTGPGNPAQKRNVALRALSCDWAALVDADAFPRADWLRNAFREVADGVGIVAGPNLTPPHDPWSRQLSGLVMRSPLGFGPAYIRHHPAPRHEPDEMPTCNMLIRIIPGLLFREEFSTAEDMMYCRDVRERGYSIVYAPDVIVFHHRRRFPVELARQFYFYGRDKGRLFALGHPASRAAHAMPALWLAYAVLLGAAGLFARSLPTGLLWPAMAYGMLVLVETVRCARSPLVALGGLLAFPVAHASYGWGYWRGLPLGLRERARSAGTRPRADERRAERRQ